MAFYKLLAGALLAACVGASVATSNAHADAALWHWLTVNGAALNFRPAFSESGLRGGIAIGDIPKDGLVRGMAPLGCT
jgi:hypothetical protein